MEIRRPIAAQRNSRCSRHRPLGPARRIFSAEKHSSAAEARSQDAAFAASADWIEGNGADPRVVVMLPVVLRAFGRRE